MSYRLVDANEIIGWPECTAELQRYINNMSAIYTDVEPEDQFIHAFNTGSRNGHGYWIDRVDKAQCSECGMTHWYKRYFMPRYCPDCGARMDGKVTLK